MHVMKAAISGANQSKNVLQRAWTRFGLSSTAEGQITNVISRVAGGRNPDALAARLLDPQLNKAFSDISIHYQSALIRFMGHSVHL